MVAHDYLDAERQFPLVIRARTADMDLPGWTIANRSFVLEALVRHGAILFRGFSVSRPDQFRRFVGIISGDPIPYREQTSPRTHVEGNVYTSTDYPSEHRILPHNENSYAITVPRKLFFWCQIPAQQGGQTPLCDTRKVLAHIDPSIAARFLEKGWMYVRNFSSHLGVPWETAFQTSDKTQVEEYCRRDAIDYEWTAAGLRTRQIRPAVARHPESGDSVWFNHAAFFHISNVEASLRAHLLSQYGESNLPNNTYYGDGSTIEDAVVRHLLHVYDAYSVSFLWEAGDAALLDNFLTAHGRAPFIGPRRILFAMAEPYTRTDSIAACK